MMFDPTYFLYVLPGFILAMIATFVTKSTFARYSRVRSSSGMTGAEAARRMLDAEGVHGVNIEMTGGMLTDHYDPRTNTLRLSPDVYRSPSLAAIGVACHEAGHALQKAHEYAPLGMRSALVPVTQFGSQAAVPLIMFGFILQFPMLVKLGILVFAAVVVFSVITLPVEWNASARAKRLMVGAGIVSPQESVHAGKVLNAAFLTYLASAVTALLTLLYYLTLANRRN
jgi:hypothetical protein